MRVFVTVAYSVMTSVTMPNGRGGRPGGEKFFSLYIVTHFAVLFLLFFEKKYIFFEKLYTFFALFCPDGFLKLIFERNLYRKFS